MKNVAFTVLGVFVAIILTGWILEEAGKGTFGGFVKDLAQKTTRGYGV